MIENHNTNITPIEAALMQNNLQGLSPEQRLSYYKSVCDSLGLNALTQPLAYITLNGKLTLYAKRDATDQLRKIHKVSISITGREMIGEVYVVTAKAKDAEGREDESTGAVPLAGLRGENLANAYLKAETKAKRRVTLSLCGLGLLDETEVDSIMANDMKAVVTPQITPPADSRRVMNHATGEVVNVGQRATTPAPDAVAFAPKPSIEQALSDIPEPDWVSEPHFDPAPMPPSRGPMPKKNPGDFEPGEYVVSFGRDKGKTLHELGPKSIQRTLDWISKECKEPLAKSLKEFKEYSTQYMNTVK